MKKNYIESILGVATFIVAALFFFQFLSVNTDRRAENYYLLKAKFLKVGGIMIGNDVKFSGVKVGVVSGVKLDSNFLAEVEFKIYSGVKVPSDSSISVSNDGILGNKYLSIIPKNRDSGDYLNKNNEIKNVKDFESIEDQVSKIIFLATQ
ncbi:MAG: MlaD family protein [Pseudomonadota bacterium]|nr:MlaD family protein [Pseudomonadota bacterium]